MASNPLLQTSSTIVGQDQQLPADNGGQALAQAGANIVEAVAGMKTRALQNDLQAVTDEAIAVHQAQAEAAKGPITSDIIAKAIGGTSDQVDDPDNAVIRPVLESIARLKLANEQGTINVDELKIRQENILRQAIARHPAFAAQFIQGAGQQLGYNPIGSTIDALADRSRVSHPKTQADEIEDYYEKQGDLLNVDRTLKYSNPAAWYAKVQKEIDFNAGLQKSTRQYQLQVVTRQSTEERALQQLRTSVMPNYGRQTVKDLLKAAQHFVGMTPEQRARSLESGELDQLRLQIGAAKVGLYDHINKMNGSLENFLTKAQIDEASKDVMAQLDYAEKAVDPVAALQGIKTHLEAVVVNNVDFKYPEFGTMERVTRMLSNIPNDSLVARKFSEEASSAIAISLSNMMGGIVNGKDPNLWTPQSVIPPEISPNMPPADRAKATREVSKRIMYNLKQTPNDPTARRAAVRTLGAFSSEYRNTLAATGQAPDQQTAQQFIDMAASDEFRAIVTDPNVAMEDMAGLSSMNEVMAAEAMDTGIEIGQDISGKSTQLTNSRLAEMVARSPYAPYYNPAFIQAMQTKTPQFSEVMRIEWRDGRAQIVPVPENDINLEGRGIDYDALTKSAAVLNAKYSKRLTSLTKATAHTAGSDDYSNAAVILDGLMNNVRFTLPE